MSENATAKLRELQARLAADAAKVHTREDYYRLQMYYGDIEAALRIDTEMRGE